jgi:DNA repair protein SbcC/Rad50
MTFIINQSYLFFSNLFKKLMDNINKPLAELVNSSNNKLNLKQIRNQRKKADKKFRKDLNNVQIMNKVHVIFGNQIKEITPKMISVAKKEIKTRQLKKRHKREKQILNRMNFIENKNKFIESYKSLYKFGIISVELDKKIKNCTNNEQFININIEKVLFPKMLEMINNIEEDGKKIKFKDLNENLLLKKEIKLLTKKHEEDILSAKRKYNEMQIKFKKEVKEQMDKFNVLLKKYKNLQKEINSIRKSAEHITDRVQGYVSYLEKYPNIIPTGPALAAYSKGSLFEASKSTWSTFIKNKTNILSIATKLKNRIDEMKKQKEEIKTVIDKTHEENVLTELELEINEIEKRIDNFTNNQKRLLDEYKEKDEKNEYIKSKVNKSSVKHKSKYERNESKIEFDTYESDLDEQITPEM